ncbi:MAG TPA: deoxyribose-phosphate aldolase [Cyclobacteriaceae bacterium]|nr:deoxyribose-phosphate aldolase [Cyclobacteriaceae bacterium]
MDFARYIEHTNLSPALTIRDIDRVVEEARQFNFFGVCVPPFWVRRAKREIGTADIVLITVAGFPLGYNMTETKLDEIRRALDNGADEVDVVWNTTSFKTGIPWTKIEIAKCAKLLHDNQKVMKVVLEASYLSDQEIAEACKLCCDAGTDFICPTTDTASYDFKVGDLKLMRSSVTQAAGIKAAGNIAAIENVHAAIAGGADRIGTTHAVSIIQTTLHPTE